MQSVILSSQPATISQAARDGGEGSGFVRSKVYVTIYQKWGTPEETVVRKVVTLNAGKDFHRIAIIEVGEE